MAKRMQISEEDDYEENSYSDEEYEVSYCQYDCS